MKRRSKVALAAGRTTTAFTPPERRPIPRWLLGRCFRCLGLGHLKAACSEHPRCYRCWFPGHLERNCYVDLDATPPRKVPAAAPAAPLRQPSSGFSVAAPQAHSAQASSKAAASERSSATPLVRAASPAPAVSAPSPTKPASAPVKPACAKPMEEGLGAGDPLLRPQGGRGVLSWTPGMSAIEQRLRGRSLVASVLSGRKEVSPATMVAALSGLCGVPLGDVRVEVSRPSDFLLSFRREEDCSAVLAWSGRFNVGGRGSGFLQALASRGPRPNLQASFRRQAGCGGPPSPHHGDRGCQAAPQQD